MKRSNIYIILIIIITLALIIMTLFGVRFLNYLLNDNNIIKGYYKAEEYFDPFATQDSVDYCKYYYTDEYDLIFLRSIGKLQMKI